jgi:hypothetical protein
LDDAVYLLEASKERAVFQLPEAWHDEESKGEEKASDEESREGPEDKKPVEDELSRHGIERC